MLRSGVLGLSVYSTPNISYAWVQVHYDNWEQTPGSLHSHTLGHNSSLHGLSGSPHTDNIHSQVVNHCDWSIRLSI